MVDATEHDIELVAAPRRGRGARLRARCLRRALRDDPARMPGSGLATARSSPPLAWREPPDPPAPQASVRPSPWSWRCGAGGPVGWLRPRDGVNRPAGVAYTARTTDTPQW